MKLQRPTRPQLEKAAISFAQFGIATTIPAILLGSNAADYVETSIEHSIDKTIEAPAAYEFSGDTPLHMAIGFTAFAGALITAGAVSKALRRGQVSGSAIEAHDSHVSTPDTSGASRIIINGVDYTANGSRTGRVTQSPGDLSIPEIEIPDIKFPPGFPFDT